LKVNLHTFSLDVLQFEKLCVVFGSNIQSFSGYIKQLPALEQNVVRKKLHTRRDKDGDDMYGCY